MLRNPRRAYDADGNEIPPMSPGPKPDRTLVEGAVGKPDRHRNGMILA
jgi:hypothetical protein